MKLVVIALAGIVCATSAEAGSVALANGNYYSAYTDIEFPTNSNGETPKLGRVYNSRSQFRGMFGYGWGNDFDTYLIPSADGSVVVQESGGGAKTRFGAPGLSSQELAILVRVIVDAKEAGSSDRLFDREAYRSRLMNNADFRDEEARQLDKTRELPVGVILYSSTSAKQTITRLPNGYVRDNGRGSKEYYEQKSSAYDSGVDISSMRRINGVYRVTRVRDDVFKRDTAFAYDTPTGRLVKVTFWNGSWLQFEYDALGVVTMATSSRGETSTYRYCQSVKYAPKQRCQQADLVWGTDSSGTPYEFAYDEQHNLIEHGRVGEAKEAIEYWRTGNQGAKKLTTENGDVREYDYWVDPADPNSHFRTTILATNPSGGTSRSTYDFWDKRRADGSSYRYRQLSKMDGDDTEKIFSECCEAPVKITTNGAVTEIDYYPDSSLKKERRTADTIENWEYAAAFGRVTKFTSKDRKSGKTTQQFSYKYDDRGTLTNASSFDGTSIAITYDSDGHIALMEDRAKNRLSFTYDKNAKPTRMALEGVGAINFSYDANGNIEDIKQDDPASPNNHGVMTKIASMFQLLSELVKPAGIKP
jgi:YD repeat-containing protein